LVAPGNIHTVGWYNGSSLPGQSGAALMDAHVHGPTMPGAFYKIKNLAAGDEIEIEMGDGRKFTYIVNSLEQKAYDDVDMNKAMLPIVPTKPGLNLITCGGKYNTNDHRYEERVVVYAVQK
jgi:sortase (surface protein transpeptidase)